MVRKIVTDPIFLAQKSEPATRSDGQVVTDLQDTLTANRTRCVGMAANMIGERKRIIAVGVGVARFVMLNPRITRRTGPYETEEGCLSLSGVRKTTRYREIEVEYLDARFRRQKGTFRDYIAQVIQHEVDHCDGILI